ncbi:nucleotidyltransferase family protein [Pseudoalteromonas phenolica]|uniref:nucleotidyltransferase domain-containing protein n=1 Tax=Pseudoalteromonas phenolica TaxID=161398 RepID=UPI00384A8C46
MKRIDDITRLVALLCKPNLSPKCIDRVNELAQLVCHSELKVALNKHRVWPTTHINIKKHFPNLFATDFKLHFEKKYLTNKKNSLLQLQASFKIKHAFKQQNLPVLDLKGNTLAQDIYQDIALRHSNDLDLYIPLDYLEQASNLLNTLGFKNNDFSVLSKEQKCTYINKHKDISYLNSNGLVVELHYRLFLRPTALDKIYQQKMLTKGDLPNSNEIEFIYLCWHGAQNFYFRMKWLLDIACYIEKHQNNIEQFAENVLLQAKKVGATNYVYLSWHLCHCVFDTTLPNSIKTKSNNIKSDLLINNALLFMKECEDLSNPKFNFKMHTLEFMFLAKGIRQRAKLFNCLVLQPNVDDLSKLPKLPGKLKFTNIIIRPFLLLWRKFFI